MYLYQSQPNAPITYGLGSFGLESLYTVFTGFYMFYYIDELGLAVAMAAIINVIYAIWDAVNDPLVGFLSDNTRTRWGRRRPWLITGLPFYVGLLVLVYAVPTPLLQGNALFWYALVIFFLFESAYTVMAVNYGSLFPETLPGFPGTDARRFILPGSFLLARACWVLHPPLIYAHLVCYNGN